MSDVEQYAKGILGPLLHGKSVTLNEYDQATLRAWIILRTMVFAVSSSAQDATSFYTRHEHLSFAGLDDDRSLEPIDGAYIWIFQYRSRRWAARAHVLNGFIQNEPGGPDAHRFQVITAFVGQFGFQVLVARWPEPRRLALNSVGVQQFAPAMSLIWPHTNDLIQWPPATVYLADESYDALVDRLVKPGLPVQRD